jgi:hypothetical protein
VLVQRGRKVWQFNADPSQNMQGGLQEGQMRITIIIFATLLSSLVSSAQQMKRVASKHVILPNPKLLRCTSLNCSQLWQTPPVADDIYPNQIVIDLLRNNYCPLGVIARYDKSISLEHLKSAIDEKYGKWASRNNATATVKLWRVEPENFSIQLSAISDGVATNDEAGTKQIIYMTFQGTRCASQP